MESLDDCCGKMYKFFPQILFCHGKQNCTIPMDAKYYIYHKKYTICQKCFEESSGENIAIFDEASTVDKMCIKKSECKELKNDQRISENSVVCCDCNKKFHQICVLHLDEIWPEGFKCENCLEKVKMKRKENIFRARNLLTTKLSEFIENRVNNFLKTKENVGYVHIRLLLNAEKIAKVKPRMKNRFVDEGKMPAEFPYRAKTIFAFQEQDGVDVCFFGMHLQEYGSECPPQNSHRVYIAYLDSVQYFQPQKYRTDVYYEILLRYMDFVRKLGYATAHFWAKPIPKNDEYIFPCRPIDQKTPDIQRLQGWYKKMLNKAIAEEIIIDYKNIFEQVMDDKINSVANLPYFQGDFWPDLLEDLNQEDFAAKFFEVMEERKEEFFVVRFNSDKTTIKDPDSLVTCDLMDGCNNFLNMATEKNFEFSSLRRAKFTTMVMLYELHKRQQNNK